MIKSLGLNNHHHNHGSPRPVPELGTSLHTGQSRWDTCHYTGPRQTDTCPDTWWTAGPRAAPDIGPHTSHTGSRWPGTHPGINGKYIIGNISQKYWSDLVKLQKKSGCNFLLHKEAVEAVVLLVGALVWADGAGAVLEGVETGQGAWGGRYWLL